MTTMSRFTACMSGTVVALAGACGASAQTDASGASGLELEEVIVTAERVTKDLQKVSQVITTYDGEQLKKEGKTRIDEILRGIAGIELQSDQVDTNIYMRGVSTGTPMIIDGVSQGTGGTTIRGTTLDVAQVAVSKGTQNGAGTTSLSGAVNVVTNKPVFEYQASGAFTAGSYNLRNTEGVLNVPISDNQAIRLAYSSDRRSGYYPNDAGNSDNRQFRLRYRWQPSENLDINASFTENRIEGNGVSQSVLLYTGHWVDLGAGQVLPWTNPYTGATTLYGQIAPATVPIFLNGNVNAANSTTITAPQYSYPAGPCTQNAAAFSTGITAAMGAVPASYNPATVGPVITTLGCPFQHLAVRDGVYFFDRDNPWDDGSRKYDWWSNTPVRDTLNRTASIDIDWKLPIGMLSIQPSYVYSVNHFVEPARGTSWMDQGGIPSNSGRLDVQLASNEDSPIQWVGGFNGSYSPRPDEGPSFISISNPAGSWTLGTAGMTANAATSTTCYTVLPTGATTQGVVNKSNCISPNYSAGGASYNYGLSAQASWPVLDTLRLNGSLRHDWYASESRGGGLTTLADGDGQRYIWYLPATTYCSPTGTGAGLCTNPNGLFQVPYRMNISQADEDALVASVHSWRKSQTTSFTFNVEYDLFPQTMVYAKFATGASGAMAAGMGGATGGTINVTLPDAVVPAGTLAGTKFVTAVNLPAPSVKGEETAQISLGEKSRWFDNRLQVNVEAFYNKFKNRGLNLILGSLYGYQSTTTGAVTCTASATTPVRVILGATEDQSCLAANVGSYTGNMLSKGVDLDVSWLPTSKDRLDLSVEYLRTTFDGVPEIGNYTAAQISQLSVDQGGSSSSPFAQTFADGWNAFLGSIDGQTMPKAPRWASTLNYQHEFDLPNGSRITPRLTGYYKSAFYFTENLMSGDTAAITDSNWAISNGKWLPSVQKGYSLFDFYTTWSAKDGKWFLSAYVRNIENEAVLSSTGGLTTWSTGSIATNDLYKTVLGGYANLEAPRTYGLTLSANF